MSKSTDRQPLIEPQEHKKCAIDLFNYVWDLMEKKERTQEENDTMVHAAHASRYHWSIVGTPVHLARGEWQVSRVYSILERFDPAAYHAQRCLDICLEHNIGDFDLAYAYEALARAYSISGKKEQALAYVKTAQEHGEKIQKEQDKALLFNDLESITIR